MQLLTHSSSVHTESQPPNVASSLRGSRTHTSHSKPPSIWRGVALAACIAMMATVLGHWVPAVGGPVFAILLGVLITNTVGMPAVCNPGIRFTARNLLQWSIIGLGFGLSFQQVVRTGLDSLWVTCITIAVAFLTAFYLGKALGITSKLRTLIGAGTAICGGSAIAAVAPIIQPDDHETVFALSTIFLFNIVAVLLFPVVGHVLGLSDLGFGLWAGTAVNDTSSVVATAYSYSTAAGDYATIVKLTRATLIIPLCIILSVLQARSDHKAGLQLQFRRLVPWFIVGFVVASLVRSSNLLPTAVLEPIQQIVMFMMVMALAAVGLSANLRQLAQTGWQPIALGLGVWVAVSCSSLLVQFCMGIW